MATDLRTQLRAALASTYALERELGRGGMATVYLARDLRHARHVAVKVLHPALAAVLGAERFLAEIRTTANLQHPHILPLFDSGEADGQLYYVMPFVDGETLRTRLERERQLPIEDVLRLTREVAAALDYAHRHGVIHRDIKPENILLHDGSVLVADFGIALAVSHAGGERMTQTGLSLGTPQYMAPEQATAERGIDARADVYALGAVAYEMLAGDPPFIAPTMQGVIAKLLSEEPRRLATLRRSVPPGVDSAIMRALQKLPADRWPSAAAFAEALSRPEASAAVAIEAPPLGGRAIPTAATAGARSFTLARRALPWVGMGLGLAVAAWLGRRSVTVPAQSIERFDIAVPATLPFAPQRRYGSLLAISPDGSRLVFVLIPAGSSRTQLHVRPLDQTAMTPIAGTEGAEQPFFSPDGEWIGFVQDGKLRKVPTGGGTPVVIADLPYEINGASWGPGGVIVFGRFLGALMRTSASGGKPVVVVAPDSTAGEGIGNPQILPDGETVLVTRSIAQGSARLATVSLVTQDTATIMSDVPFGRFLRGGDRADDRLIHVRWDGTVLIAPFDLRRKRASGPAVPVAEGAPVSAGAVAVALNGTFAFRRRGDVRRELVTVEANGTVNKLTPEVRGYRSPRYSPDGKQITVGAMVGNNDQNADLMSLDIERGVLSRLTFDQNATFPEYTPDGKWIIYSALVRPDDRDLLRVPAGGGHPETVLAIPGQQHEGQLTPDGKLLVYRDIGGATGRDIWVVPLDGGARRPLAATPFDEYGLALSHDGRWLAYVSNASGRTEVYVRPVADTPEKRQVSLSGGDEPRWDRTGRALYYRNGDTLFTVAVETTPTFRLGARRVLFTGRFVKEFRAAYDVSPDGRRFVMVRDVADDRGGQVTVVLHAVDRR